MTKTRLGWMSGVQRLLSATIARFAEARAVTATRSNCVSIWSDHVQFECSVSSIRLPFFQKKLSRYSQTSALQSRCCLSPPLYPLRPRDKGKRLSRPDRTSGVHPEIASTRSSRRLQRCRVPCKTRKACRREMPSHLYGKSTGEPGCILVACRMACDRHLGPSHAQSLSVPNKSQKSQYGESEKR